MSNVFRKMNREQGVWKRRTVEMTNGATLPAWKAQGSTPPGVQGPAQSLSAVEMRRRIHRHGATPTEGPMQRALRWVRGLARGRRAA